MSELGSESARTHPTTEESNASTSPTDSTSKTSGTSYHIDEEHALSLKHHDADGDEAANSDGLSTKTLSKPRKKKRSLGNFPCPDCDKVFTRSDHLARHHLNHDPKEVFECDFVIQEQDGSRHKCAKRFVRKDLKERHARRHLELMTLDLVSKKRHSPSIPTDQGNTHDGTDQNSGKRNKKANPGKSMSPTPLTSAAPATAITSNNASLTHPTYYHSPLQISNLVHSSPMTNAGASEGFNNMSPDKPLKTPLNPTALNPMIVPGPVFSSSSPSHQQAHQQVPQQPHVNSAAPTYTNVPTSGHKLVNSTPYSTTPDMHRISPGFAQPDPSLTSAPSLQQHQQVPSYSNQQNQFTQFQLQSQQNHQQLRQQQGEHMPLLQNQHPHQPGHENNKEPNFADTYPQSQTDILSWLFTDQNSNYLLQHQQTQQQLHLHEQQHPQQSLNSDAPQTLNASTESPIASNFQPQQALPDPQSAPNMPVPWVGAPPGAPSGAPPMADELNHVALTPFYHPATQLSDSQIMNNLDIQDMNFFQNEDNPLDKVFSKNFQQKLQKQQQLQEGHEQQQHSEDGRFGNIGNMGMNLLSTASSSPSNTADSFTPRTASGTESACSPEAYNVIPTQGLVRKMIHEHGLNENTVKNRHMFIDSLLVNSLIKSLPTLSRSQIESCFRTVDEYCTLEDRLSFYLSKYWSIFHPQFTILHKPSFDTKSAEPLLLLAMSIIGCNYCSPKPQFKSESGILEKSSGFKYSTMVATPLRFMIFQHEDFKTPVKLWILQALNLLEWSEKNFLSRRMHERAHIHHGTTVQLLRRSPLLGGNPTTANKQQKSNSGTATSTNGEESSDVNSADISSTDKSDSTSTDLEMFTKWVESESMKRITFMTFYLDIVDYIKFRHNPQITFYQLQLLSLPCDDAQLWDSAELNGSFKKIVKRQKKLQNKLNEFSSHSNKLHPNMEASNKHTNHRSHGNSPSKLRMGTNFINSLKKILKPTDEDNLLNKNVSLFTRKILFAGLVNIMYQLQQTDLQNNSSLLTANGITSNKKNQAWKEVLTKALDNWTIQTSCYGGVKQPDLKVFNCKPFQCKFPMYHLTQIIGMADINHYDIAIFGGSPANQSVDATKKDRSIVRRKLNSMWLKNSHVAKKSINDIINLKSVIHCYLILWELMLKPIDDPSADDKNYNVFVDWSVENDYYDSMYAIGIATLVLWSYSYSTYGLESHRFDENEAQLTRERDYGKLVEYSAEGGYQYLLRIRQEFLTNLRKSNLHNDFTIHPFKLENNRHSPHEILSKHCELLPLVPNKQNTSGLCFLVGSKLLTSQWEVLRENAKLIINCGLISLGKSNISCEDLFDNNLVD